MIPVLAMTGCGKTDPAGKPAGKQPAGVNDVLQKGMAEADDKKADNPGLPAEENTQNPQNTEGQEAQTPGPSPEPVAEPATAYGADEVDVDLTALSGTMVYSEVDEEICVAGVFDTYREGEYTYCTLRNAELM